MKLVVGGLSDKGIKRTKNEDFFCVDEKTGLLAVADGMGGHSSGEIASRMAIEVLSDYIKNDGAGYESALEKAESGPSETSNALVNAITIANGAVYEAGKSSSSRQGMGTTLAAALIKEDRMSIAHVGDSRIYLVRAGCLEQLTDDHSLISEQVKEGLISEEDAEKSTIKNIITRAIGIAPEVKPDCGEMALADGDMIIICSDGITSMIPDDKILSVALSGGSPSSLCQKMVDMANSAGGNDNITIIVAIIYKHSISHYTHSIKNLFGR